MEFLIKAGQLILSLSILIVLHEMGHFIPARLFKTRVEKFYLFFDPWFSLFKHKRGDTEYGIGWLPLGGYVKISGMIDESMDKEAMSKPPEDWEFRAKPVWQRLIIMVGGVTVNLILGYLIYMMVLFNWGKEYVPIENAAFGVACDSVLIANGFQNGDKVLSIDGKKPSTVNDVGTDILIMGKQNIVVERNGEEVAFTLPEDIHNPLMENGARVPISERIPFVIDSMPPDRPAREAGLEEGDQILGMNGEVLPFFDQFKKACGQNKSKEVTVQVLREGEKMDVTVKVDSLGRIGVWPKGPRSFFETTKLTYTFAESIPAGFAEGNDKLHKYVMSLRLLFTPSGMQQMGGFGAIGGLFSPRWDWESFWYLTAFISIILAFMNILPIPALDGGHVMFLLYEMIAGRKPGDKFLEYAQIAGMVLLLGLVLFANGNDIYKWFTG